MTSGFSPNQQIVVFSSLTTDGNGAVAIRSPRPALVSSASATSAARPTVASVISSPPKFMAVIVVSTLAGSSVTRSPTCNVSPFTMPA